MKRPRLVLAGVALAGVLGPLAAGAVLAGPAAAAIPVQNPGPNCFGGATSYGNQLNVVNFGEASGQVLLEEGVNPGQSQQYYRTVTCG